MPLTSSRSSRTKQSDRMALSYDAYHSSDHPWYDIDLASEKPQPDLNILVLVVAFLELLVLIFMSVLEFYLRECNWFPMRKVTFSCSDPDISYQPGNYTFADFSYQAVIPDVAVIVISFCLPPFLIFVCELAVWAFTKEPQKTITLLTKHCKVPQVLRRIIRFVAMFIFGMLATMIFTDVSKFMVGRLRPTFLSTCKPSTMCPAGSDDVSVCTETDQYAMCDARRSFPSFQAAITAFSAGFMAVYFTNIISMKKVRILRPFIAFVFIMLALLCALDRYGLHHNYWTDVAVGFAGGLIFALYLTIFVLNSFHERVDQHDLYRRLNYFMTHQRSPHLTDDPLVQRTTSIIIPRPHVTSSIHGSNADIANGKPELSSQPIHQRKGKVNNSFHYELDGAVKYPSGGHM